MEHTWCPLLKSPGTSEDLEQLVENSAPIKGCGIESPMGMKHEDGLKKKADHALGQR